MWQLNVDHVQEASNENKLDLEYVIPCSSQFNYKVDLHEKLRIFTTHCGDAIRVHMTTPADRGRKGADLQTESQRQPEEPSWLCRSN